MRLTLSARGPTGEGSMLRRSLILLAFLAACHSTTEPKGLDPVVLITNTGGGPMPIILTWWDYSGQVATWTVPVGATQCIHFVTTLPTDSVRFMVFSGDSTPGSQFGYLKEWSPWFDPKTGL